MWPDNETELDFLNFGGVADTVAEIIIQADGKPVSVGVSGAWGVGKSSMIRLIAKALSSRDEVDSSKFVVVEFNAWLYQGYDDARAALMDVIADRLREEAEKRQKAVAKIKELFGRINWLRGAKLAAVVGGVLAGHPREGFTAAGALQMAESAVAGKVDKKVLDEAQDDASKIGAAAKGLINPKAEWSPPKEIQALRNCFEDTLKELGITLVVLVDDLDRCLPETTISTLEAMRLFLFLKNAAFVIAADNAMIRHAVRRHFNGVDDDLVTNYFDKLIQIPIQVPFLGTQEVRAYMMLSFVENSDLGADDKDTIRTKVCEQLGQTWQGKRADAAFIESLKIKLPAALRAQLETADRLAPIMTSASRIHGNPRLIKRFLNALAIRLTIAKAHNIGLDETALAKMLLFERCANAKAYEELAAAVTNDAKGRPLFLKPWEDAAKAGTDTKLTESWDDNFIREWLTLPPQLAEMDLRGVLYVSREHAPIMTPEDRLSSEGAAVLTALVDHPDMATTLAVRVKTLTAAETDVIMRRLLDAARQEQEWGVPAILTACLVVAEADPRQGERLAAFLSDRPSKQIKPSIVPKISGHIWTESVWKIWEKDQQVGQPVKAAITANRKKDGNVVV
jgi:predicted KAP-like P-loop ATPase